jgi:hypothetical protein
MKECFQFLYPAAVGRISHLKYDDKGFTYVYGREKRKVLKGEEPVWASFRDGVFTAVGRKKLLAFTEGDIKKVYEMNAAENARFVTAECTEDVCVACQRQEGADPYTATCTLITLKPRPKTRRYIVFLASTPIPVLGSMDKPIILQLDPDAKELFPTVYVLAEEGEEEARLLYVSAEKCELESVSAEMPSRPEGLLSGAVEYIKKCKAGVSFSGDRVFVVSINKVGDAVFPFPLCTLKVEGGAVPQAVPGAVRIGLRPLPPVLEP